MNTTVNFVRVSLGEESLNSVHAWLQEVNETAGRLRSLVDNPPTLEVIATPGKGEEVSES